jgi:hypothetical protein
MSKNVKPRPAEPHIQGEGDYEAARRHRKRAEEFAAERDTERLAREAEPTSEEEDRELRDAEREGRARTKGATKIDKEV